MAHRMSNDLGISQVPGTARLGELWREPIYSAAEGERDQSRISQVPATEGGAAATADRARSHPPTDPSRIDCVL